MDRYLIKRIDTNEYLVALSSSDGYQYWGSDKVFASKYSTYKRAVSALDSIPRDIKCVITVITI